jgi:hypothetical protein
MKTSYWLRRIAAFLLLSCATTVYAQTSAGAGSIMVFPAVASTASYDSTISVQNRNAVPITLSVLFYEALNSTNKGLHTCTPIGVPTGQSLSFTLRTQCGLNTANHFGILVLKNADPADQTNVFYAYSRAETPQAVGFSVEGFPIGNFSGATSYVLGLKRSSSGPKYQTNCYIAALGERIDFKITLYNGADGSESAPLGPFSGALLPFVSFRFLDVFTALGVAPGPDYSDVRAKYEITAVNSVTGGIPAYIGACTVQESNTFSADFRIAKSQDALDFRQKRRTCYGQSSCGVLLTGTDATNVIAASDRNIHSLFIAQADFVKCDLVGDAPTLAQLQIRLREPGDVQGSPVFVPASPYNVAPFTAGGASLNGFYIYTGERSEWNLGSTDRWFIDVEAKDGSSGTLDYGITCTSGNGVSVPYIRTVAARIPDASF